MATLIDNDRLKQIIEAALMAADAPLTVDHLTRLFAHGELDSDEGRAQIRDTLKALEEDAAGRGYELKRVASGYRYQVRQELSEWVSRLWEEKPPRYSRALLETLALIAYRQPVTRGDIEQVRGVSVSQNIMRTLQERGWIRVVGQREVPGKPSLYGTTREFLDYFDLKSLDQLPPLTEIKSLIEPLVLEEVAEEARQVAEHDHPEFYGLDGEEPNTDTEPSEHARTQASETGVREAQQGRGAEAPEDGGAEAPEDGGAEAGAQHAGAATDSADRGAGEDAELEQAAERSPSADVVRLPTQRR